MEKRGEVVAVRFGRSVRYDKIDLDELIERCKTGAVAELVG
jgi:hypothetical protein